MDFTINLSKLSEEDKQNIIKQVGYLDLQARFKSHLTKFPYIMGGSVEETGGTYRLKLTIPVGSSAEVATISKRIVNQDLITSVFAVIRGELSYELVLDGVGDTATLLKVLPEPVTTPK